MRLLEGLALLELHRVEESVRAFSDAVTAADALLALADSNVAALQARALALSGLAAATGDPARATRGGRGLRPGRCRHQRRRRGRRHPPPARCDRLPTTGPVSSPRSAPRRIRDGRSGSPERAPRGSRRRG